MKTWIVVMALLFAGMTVSWGQVEYGANAAAGNYAEVKGIRIYYEIYGKGEPLLLLHGNGGSIAAFSSQIPELSKHFKVIAADSRAQGKSTDANMEITYALMASDRSALIDSLHLGSVFVWDGATAETSGWSWRSLTRSR
ncbi:MAG: alpha/beta hydrolase [Candidatus Acidiferrales bacterium]